FCIFKFLATGDSYQTIAFSYRLGHSTVRSICLDVCNAINEILLAEYIPTPCKEKWLEIANEMWTMWNFPNCLGALDGKHVTIQAPANSGSLYFNYKKSFSIILLALVDANCKFIAVDVGSYGKNSDGGIFANSVFKKNLESGKLNVPEDSPLPGTNTIAPYVILGDEAFPLKKYLMRPYPGSKSIEDNEKRIFNYRLCKGRRLVECAFGMLSQTF
uniref:protein ALP1-like n=1 Tax=Osmia lignaria TaxID=473952 RepID=UPI001478F110